MKAPRELAHEFLAEYSCPPIPGQPGPHAKQCDDLTALIEARDAEVREATWEKIRTAVGSSRMP